MASPLRIPKQYKNGLAKLISIEDKSIQELLRAIENISPAVYLKDITEDAAAQISTIPPDAVRDIITVVHSLYSLKSGADVPTSEFVEDLIEGMNQSEFDELNIQGDNRERFKQHLIQLLSVDSFYIASKAHGLLFEFERNLLDSRILTDIRPIFGDQSDVALDAAVVVHTLRLGYYEGDQTKEFYVTLDVKDIQELIDALKRAQSKAENLKSVLERAGITYLKVE